MKNKKTKLSLADNGKAPSLSLSLSRIGSTNLDTDVNNSVLQVSFYGQDYGANKRRK